jgi:hypothetical protein
VNLTSPVTLLEAWLLAPALVVLLSAGLGWGVQLASSLRLGALLVPTGFLTGIVVVQVGLSLGLGAALAAALLVAAACAGPVAAALRSRSSRPALARLASRWRSERGSVMAPPGKRRSHSPEPPRLGRRRRFRWGEREQAFAWPALAGLGAFAVAMAPLVGSGRAGILGYVLSNDSSVHISTVELLHDIGLNLADAPQSSFGATVSQLSGYPLGSLAWPLAVRVLLGVDPFLSWSPLIAATVAMTALVAYAVLRQIGAGRPFAAVAGAAISSGYLSFSYLAQGNPKEAGLATAILAAVALFAALKGRVTVRRVVPAALAIVAAISIFGLGALAFAGPLVLVVAVRVIGTADRGLRVRTAAALALGVAVSLPLTLPFLSSALSFIEESRSSVTDPNAVGNLLGPVPWIESFNIWLAGDYRFPDPEYALLTHAGIALAAALAVLGVAVTAWRRLPAVPLAVLAVACGVLAISRSASIYFDAKTYVVLSAGLGLATAAGVVVLARRWRPAGITAGVALVVLVAASDAAVYQQAWVTPKERFQELADLGERYAGQGPTLISEREDYGRYFLRDADPWESWGPWYIDRGLREFSIPPPPPYTPDLDDYRLDYLQRFRLILERKRPGGSSPPSGYEPAQETPHYRVWRRTGALPAIHVPLGAGSVSGSAPLDCSTPEVRDVLRKARRSGTPVRYAQHDPVVESLPKDWNVYGTQQPGPQAPYILRRGGYIETQPALAPGRYQAWIQGSFCAGVRMYSGGRAIGEVHGDLGQQDQWNPLGTIDVRRARPVVSLIGLEKPGWQSGSRRPDITGEIAYSPVPDGARVREVAGARAQQRLCGRTLDWIELP